jgi:hypothetical protein
VQTTNTKLWNDAFTAMSDAAQESLRAGLRMQDESLRFWKDMFSGSGDENRGRFENISRMARENADRAVRLVDEQAERTITMARKALELGTARDAAEYADKLGDFWRQGFEAANKSFEAMSKAAGETMSEWNQATQAAFANGHGKTAKAKTGRATK